VLLLCLNLFLNSKNFALCFSCNFLDSCQVFIVNLASLILYILQTHIFSIEFKSIRLFISCRLLPRSHHLLILSLFVLFLLFNLLPADLLKFLGSLCTFLFLLLLFYPLLLILTFNSLCLCLLNLLDSPRFFISLDLIFLCLFTHIFLLNQLWPFLLLLPPHCLLLLLLEPFICCILTFCIDSCLCYQFLLIVFPLILSIKCFELSLSFLDFLIDCCHSHLMFLHLLLICLTIFCLLSLSCNSCLLVPESLLISLAACFFLSC